MKNRDSRQYSYLQQQPDQNAHQRIQQFEEMAKHYTEAANALRNKDEDSSERHLQQAQQLQQQFDKTRREQQNST